MAPVVTTTHTIQMFEKCLIDKTGETKVTSTCFGLGLAVRHWPLPSPDDGAEVGGGAVANGVEGEGVGPVEITKCDLHNSAVSTLRAKVGAL